MKNAVAVLLRIIAVFCLLVGLILLFVAIRDDEELFYYLFAGCFVSYAFIRGFSEIIALLQGIKDNTDAGAALSAVESAPKPAPAPAPAEERRPAPAPAEERRPAPAPRSPVRQQPPREPEPRQPQPAPASTRPMARGSVPLRNQLGYALQYQTDEGMLNFLNTRGRENLTEEDQAELDRILSCPKGMVRERIQAYMGR